MGKEDRRVDVRASGEEGEKRMGEREKNRR